MMMSQYWHLLKVWFHFDPSLLLFCDNVTKYDVFFTAFGSVPTTLQNIDPMSPAVGQWPDGAREGGAVQQGLALPPVHPHLLDQGQPQEPHPLRPPQVLHGETIRLSILRPELRHQAESAGWRWSQDQATRMVPWMKPRILACLVNLVNCKGTFLLLDSGQTPCVDFMRSALLKCF